MTKVSHMKKSGNSGKSDTARVHGSTATGKAQEFGDGCQVTKSSIKASNIFGFKPDKRNGRFNVQVSRRVHRVADPTEGLRRQRAELVQAFGSVDLGTLGEASAHPFGSHLLQGTG